MRKRIVWEWEILDEFTKRSKVIGGWLVEYGSHTNKGCISNSMAFVPDRDHEWETIPPFDHVAEARKKLLEAEKFKPKS